VAKDENKKMYVFITVLPEFNQSVFHFFISSFLQSCWPATHTDAAAKLPRSCSQWVSTLCYWDERVQLRRKEVSCSGVAPVLLKLSSAICFMAVLN